MNINVNSNVTNNKNYKTNNIQPNIPIINTEKVVTIEDIDNAYNSFLKSDSYSNTTSSLQIKSYTDLFSFVKKVLYNEQFREIAINSNPILKEAYDNFINAITMDDSKLGEYIKSVLNDSSKFSGEFFDALNRILLESNDIGLKNSICEFLKIFDYYFTQIENASGVNSSFNDILSNLPEDIKNKLFELLANNSLNKLNIFLLSAFNLNLPEREKLKVILSYMLDLIGTKDNLKNDDPLNIFMPKEQVSDDTIDVVNATIKALKNSNAELPKDIKSLFDTLETEINNIKSTQSENSLDKLIWSSDTRKQAANIDMILKLAQNITKNESNIIEKGLDDIVKFILGLKESIPILISNTLSNINSKNVADILIIFDSIKKEILTNDVYTKEVKEQIIFLFDKVANNILEKLIYGDVSKNKCEILLNLYEKEIMPILLKNNAILPKNTLSALTHNLLRLKLGTASEFNKQVIEFFKHLEYNKIIDNEQALFMKFELANKIITKQEANEGITSFLKLLDNGIKFSSNDLNKTTFENILLSLISKNDVSIIYKHLFIPLLYNEANVLSEIFISKEKKINDNEESKFEELLDTILKVTIILDIEEKGIFNTTLFYSDGQVSAKIIMPDKYQSSYETVSEEISKIIQKNMLIPKGVLVTNDI